MPYKLENNTDKADTTYKAKRDKDMIESKLKAKNYSRKELFRLCWVSSARYGNMSNEVIGRPADHPLNANGDDLKSKFLQIDRCHIQNA